MESGYKLTKNDMQWYIYHYALVKWSPIKIQKELRLMYIKLSYFQYIDPVMTLKIKEQIINLKQQKRCLK